MAILITKAVVRSCKTVVIIEMPGLKGKLRDAGFRQYVQLKKV